MFKGIYYQVSEFIGIRRGHKRKTEEYCVTRLIGNENCYYGSLDKCNECAERLENNTIYQRNKLGGIHWEVSTKVPVEEQKEVDEFYDSLTDRQKELIDIIRIEYYHQECY